MVLSLQSTNLNIKKGMEQFGDDEDLYLEILGYYVSDMGPLLESLQANSSTDLTAYSQAAHGIKGASRSVFADGIGDAAEKLEQAAKNNEVDYIVSHHEELLEEAQELLQSIEGKLKEKGFL